MVPRQPMFTFAGNCLRLHPDEARVRGIYQPKFDAERWLCVVEAERPVAVFLVPAMAHLLLDHPRFDAVDFSSIAICSVGSAPLRRSWWSACRSGCPTPWSPTITA